VSDRFCSASFAASLANLSAISLIEQLTIFSDSQTAIGILTLHWKIENHKRITLEIFDKMKRIQKKWNRNKNTSDTRTCECLMMEIVVESSSITEIPSVLPFFP
jgi:ribonuclease HI